MAICAVVGCCNRSKSSSRKDSANTNLFRLPKVVEWQDERTKALSSKRRSLWLARIKRADLKGDLPNIRVCGAHFVAGRPSKLCEETNPDWAPTLLLGYKANNEGTARYERAAKRRFKRTTPEVDAVTAAPARAFGVGATPTENRYDDGDDDRTYADSPSLPRAECEGQAAENESGAAVQAEMTMTDIAALEQQCTALNDNLSALRAQIHQLEWTEAAFRESKAKVVYYTAMANFDILYGIFKVLECYVPHGVNNSLSKFRGFILFIMKMKLNLHDTDLGFRFGVSEATVSRIFDKWLYVADCRLKPYISWPDRVSLQQTIPQAFFDSFGANVATVIDCFEIKIERPSSYEARSETWLQYKQSKTAKFLIGTAPQGVVTFISEGCGGRCSDKHIREHCGILDNLHPGDVVLADRGFNISESVGFFCARLHVPAYTKGKKQLARPYRVEDFRYTLAQHELLGEVIALGAYRMSHVWAVALKDSEAVTKIVSVGELPVKGNRCLVNDPANQDVRLKLHWLLHNVPDEDVRAAFASYGKVTEVSRDRWRVRGMSEKGSTTRLVTLKLKAGVKLDDLPHQLNVSGEVALVVVPGRPLLCLRCRNTGHIRKDCRVPRCGACPRFGQEDGQCARTYASIAGPGTIEDSSELLNDEADAVEAARETAQPATRDKPTLRPLTKQSATTSNAVTASAT
ncbi:uncharacterized protein LOC125943702 [Dermacentor silvarum]|uniref:uncharacterized protein LOC125943702 n=1 Tax=Dermacentor silvarum TaxID=543639 RepID=UPI0021008FF8|nr:uncharacterized protein LOC125943702 [Dermacentor silvarum]